MLTTKLGNPVARPSLDTMGTHGRRGEFTTCPEAFEGRAAGQNRKTRQTATPAPRPRTGLNSSGLRRPADREKGVAALLRPAVAIPGPADIVAVFYRPGGAGAGYGEPAGAGRAEQ